MYMIVKHLHQATVLVTACLFIIRLYWLASNSSLLRMRWVRIVPHINDSLLLLSAITLVIITGFYPWHHQWVLAKIVALLVYIGLGSLAIKPGRPRAIRLGCGVAALVVLVYIILVAVRHNPWPL